MTHLKIVVLHLTNVHTSSYRPKSNHPENINCTPSTLNVTKCIQAFQRRSVCLHTQYTHTPLCKRNLKFYVLLTVHLVITSVNDQPDALFFSYLFISILCMFRATLCSSSGESIVSIRHLVYLTLCRWPSSMRAEPMGKLELMNSNSPMLAVVANKFDKYPMLCVQFWAPDDGRRNSLKHVEYWQ
jgi:hypothetical protein